MFIRDISRQKAISIFIGFTLYFYFLLLTLFPFLKHTYNTNSSVYWFITGYFLFIPLFMTAFLFVKFEGAYSFKQMLLALNIKPLSNSDWKYSLAGLAISFLATGLIFGISFILSYCFGIAELNTTPWFLQIQPYKGTDRLLLLIWLPMFFFNIVGEEIMWRGYIQSRLRGKGSWILCSILWMIFHLPFGLDLMLMLIPITIIVPFVFSKTRNTSIGIFIHGVYNGPIFIAVALGLIG